MNNLTVGKSCSSYKKNSRGDVLTVTWKKEKLLY